MGLQDFFAAIALLLIIEGVMPFLNPAGMRRAMLMVSQLNDRTLRFAGLTAMVLGCLLLYVIR